MKIFRVSIPCLSYHSQWSLTSPCGLVSTWVRTNEIREWMWTGKNPLVTYHPALPKGRIQFYYTNLYSAKKKKRPTEKGFPQGSIHQWEGGMHALWLPVRDWPSEKTPMDPHSKIISCGSPGFHAHCFASAPSKTAFSSSTEMFLQPLNATNNQLIQSSWMLVGVIRP